MEVYLDRVKKITSIEGTEPPPEAELPPCIGPSDLVRVRLTITEGSSASTFSYFVFNGGKATIRLFIVGQGERREWLPRRPEEVLSDVMSPLGWTGSAGFTYEGAFLSVIWATETKESGIAPGAELGGFAIHTRASAERLAALPSRVRLADGTCFWAVPVTETQGAEGRFP